MFMNQDMNRLVSKVTLIIFLLFSVITCFPADSTFAASKGSNSKSSSSSSKSSSSGSKGYSSSSKSSTGSSSTARSVNYSAKVTKPSYANTTAKYSTPSVKSYSPPASKALASKATSFFKGAGSLLKSAANGIKSVASSVKSTVKAVVKAPLKAVRAVVNKVAKVTPGPIKNVIKKVGTSVARVTAKVTTGIKKAVNKVSQNVKTIASNKVKQVMTKVNSITKSVAKVAKKADSVLKKSGIVKSGNFFSNSLQKATDGINRFAIKSKSTLTKVGNFIKSPQTKAIGNKIVNGVQTALDVAGLVPGLGEVADLANAGISLVRGDMVGAGLSLAACIPFVGSAATAGKYLKKGSDALGMAKGLIKPSKQIGNLISPLKKTTKEIGGLAKGKLDSAKTVVKNKYNDLLKNPVDKLKGKATGFMGIVKGSQKQVVEKLTGKLDNLMKKGYNNPKVVASTGGFCFVAGTPIVTSAGTVDIEKIKAGDIVLSTNELTGETSYKEVVRTFVRTAEVLVTITTTDERIESTREHPYWVSGKGFIDAKDVVVGDLLRTADGSLSAVNSVEVASQSSSVKVYNFEVKDNHTYYVGQKGVLVHNTCSAPLPEGKNPIGKVKDAFKGGTKTSTDFVVSENGVVEAIGNGQHVLEKHVGMTDSELLARLSNNTKISGASTYTNDVIANRVVNLALNDSANISKIESWLAKGAKGNLPLKIEGADVVGRGASQGSILVENMTNAKIILKSDGVGGYDILTSYPTK